jgi:hypothetical protein
MPPQIGNRIVGFSSSIACWPSPKAQPRTMMLLQ